MVIDLLWLQIMWMLIENGNRGNTHILEVNGKDGVDDDHVDDDDAGDDVDEPTEGMTPAPSLLMDR